MKKALLFSFLIFGSCILSCTSSDAQGPLVKQWDYRYGGTANDKMSALLETIDGGFLLAGYTESDSSGDITNATKGTIDYWIVKLNANGIKQWDKRYGGDNVDALTAALQTTDGGYLLGGISTSGISGDKSEPCWGSSDYWIIKIDSLGTKQWDKRFGGTDDDNLSSLCVANDGGYLLGGTSNSPADGDKTDSAWTPYINDFWVVKTDAYGNKQWDKRFGGNEVEQLSAVSQTADHGFLLAGFSESDSSGNKTQHSRGIYDYWIVKTDSTGNFLWDQRYGGDSEDLLFSFTEATGGGYVLAGYSFSNATGDKTEPIEGVSDYWIVKIDANGSKQWDKDFGGSNTEDDLGNILQTSDGGYLIPGNSYSPASGDKSEDNLGSEQSWLVKTDQNGNKQWDKTIFTTGHDEGAFVVEPEPGCYVLGIRCSADSGGYKTQANWDTTAQPMTTYDYWAVKFCDSTQTTGITATSFEKEDVTIYPNPFTGTLSININKFKTGKAVFLIKDVLGKTVFNKTENNLHGQTKTFNLSFLSNGIYLMKIIADGERTLKKIVKE